MDERMKLVADYIEGRGSMSALCAHYGVSRRTGYKWVNRYKAEGVDGLKERTRAPRRRPHTTSPAVVSMLIEAKHKHPVWGPKKLVAWLAEKHPNIDFPAPSTAANWLGRHGLVKTRGKRHRVPAYSSPLAHAEKPNDVWCADFKGQFKMGGGDWCYPLTISDASSRFLVECRGLPNTRAKNSQAWFQRAFERYGLPMAIRTDNGAPFVTKAAGGLSRLSVWWHKLGIIHERIEPGHPEQNGRHERMHLTLKLETARPPKSSFRSQQKAFDLFREEFNVERPHEALHMQAPGKHYVPSGRPLPATLSPMEYPDGYRVRKVVRGGRFRWPGRHAIHVGAPLEEEYVGCKQLDDERWEVYFGTLLLGFIDISMIDIGLIRAS